MKPAFSCKPLPLNTLALATAFVLTGARGGTHSMVHEGSLLHLFKPNHLIVSAIAQEKK